MEAKPELNDLAGRLRWYVEVLAGLIGPRSIARPRALEAAEAFIRHELPAAVETVTRAAYRVRQHEVANLILERRGTKRPDEIVILGAHYDTVSFPPTPGADDNASAVAVMLATAHLLAGRTLRRTVRFVAFPCEEPPHFYTNEMGSQVYAHECRARGERIIGMLCLEMVGYYSHRVGSQAVPERIPRLLRWWLPKRGNFLAAVGDLRSWRLCRRFRRGFRKGTRFPLFAFALPRRVDAINLSDNSSFWDQGYAALMLTDTSFLRNPHYHALTDTPDTLDYAAMAEVTRGVAAAIAYLAG